MFIINFFKSINFHDFFKQLGHAGGVIMGVLTGSGLLDPAVTSSVTANIDRVHEGGWALVVLALFNWLSHNKA